MLNYSLKQILTFIEVAREKSVSKAAGKLFVTQPAVSMQIKQLEDTFGIPLLEASGRNIRLTHAGEEFLMLAISAIARFKDLEATMAEYAGKRKGRIDLAIVSTAKYFVPMLLVRFNQLLPDIDIKLRIDNRENILGMLSRNEVDLVVMGRAPNSLECEATSFTTNPQGIICAPNHPLSRRTRASFDSLKDYPFVVRESGSGTRAAMERLFSQHDIPMRVSMEMPSNETIKQAVMAGMGMSFLSLRTVRHELAAGHLCLVDINGMPIVGQWFITHLKQKKLSPAAQAFKQFLIEQGNSLINEWA